MNRAWSLLHHRSRSVSQNRNLVALVLPSGVDDFTEERYAQFVRHLPPKAKVVDNPEDQCLLAREMVMQRRLVKWFSLLDRSRAGRTAAILRRNVNPSPDAIWCSEMPRSLSALHPL
jgi:hypothetical protein